VPTCVLLFLGQVNIQTGSLERWEVGRHPLLAQGVESCLFRAPLDNDLGGSGKTSFAARLGLFLISAPAFSSCCTFFPVQGFYPGSTIWLLNHIAQSCTPRWKEAGLDCLVVVPDTVKTSVQQISDSAVRVHAQYLLRPSEDEALRAADIGASGVSEVMLDLVPAAIISTLPILLPASFDSMHGT